MNNDIQFEDNDALSLFGIPVLDVQKVLLNGENPELENSSLNNESGSVEESGEFQEQQLLAFREIDVPGRDFQPRLLRFGDAA